MARLLLMNELLEERQLRQERIVRDRLNPFDSYTDAEFYGRFRLTRPVAVDLVELLRDQLKHMTARSNAVPELLQVLIALRFSPRAVICK